MSFDKIDSHRTGESGVDSRPVFLIPLRPGEWGELMRVGSTPGDTYRAADFHRVVYRPEPEHMGWAIYDIDAPAGHELIGDAETLEVARQLVRIHGGVLMDRAKAALSETKKKEPLAEPGRFSQG